MRPECLASRERPHGHPESSQHAVPAVTHPVVALALAALLAAPGGAAQNLLTNPAVFGTVAPWTGCPSNSTRLSDRNDTCTDSSSAVATSWLVDCGVGYNDSFNQVVLRQCVPLAGTGVVPGSTTVFYSGWGLVNRPVQTTLAIAFFDSADCTGSMIDEGSGTLLAPALQWVPFELQTALVPESAASIEYRLFALDASDNSEILLFLDDAYLGPDPLLFAGSFEETPQLACLWSSYAP